jgi:hypothetical protein
MAKTAGVPPATANGSEQRRTAANNGPLRSCPASAALRGTGQLLLDPRRIRPALLSGCALLGGPPLPQGGRRQ